MAKSGPRRRARTTSGALGALGPFVADRRRALGVTQRELADLAEVGLSSVRALEAGQETMTLAIVLRIVDALGLTLVVATRPAVRNLPGSVEIGSGKVEQ